MPGTPPPRLVLTLLLATATPAAAQQPSHQRVTAELERGLAALARADTAGYLAGTGRAYRLASEDAVAVFGAGADSAFRHLVKRPEFGRISARIEQARRPISPSEPAFELPERDLVPEGTAWDSTSGILFLSSFYKRKIVAVGRDGTARDFIGSGQDDIGSVAGLEVGPSRRTLWAVSVYLPESPVPPADSTLRDAGALFAYDVDTGRPRRRWILPPAGGVGHGSNDLTVLPNGDVCATDSRAGAVYRLPAGADSLVELVPPGAYVFPNRITRNADGTRLFIAHSAGIDRLDLPSGRRRLRPRPRDRSLVQAARRRLPLDRGRPGPLRFGAPS